MKSIIDGDGKLGFQTLGGLGPLPSEDKTGRIHSSNFDGGIRLDRSPKEIPINSCVDMNKARFQSGALMSGFDKSALSTAAPDVVAGIVDHARIVSSDSVIATMRCLVNIGTGLITLQRWTGSVWTTEATEGQVIGITAIAMLSLQDTLIIGTDTSGGVGVSTWAWNEGTGNLDIVDATADIGARYLAKFGDRLILFQDINTGSAENTELQSFAFSVDGSILDFTSVGSGQIFLLDTPSHPVDELMGGAQVGNNVLAVFRQRSIMRGFETGNTAQSVGVIHWIEGIGTESPFSITPVSIGVCFLGHNGLAYLLTEQGPTPIGEALQDDILSRLTAANRRNGVQAAYDNANQHWWLCVPDNGSSNLMTVGYIFDLGRFLTTREKVWMKRDLTDFGGGGVQSVGSTAEVL